MVNSPPNPRAPPGSTLPGSTLAAASSATANRPPPKITDEPLREPLVVLSADPALLADLKRIAAPRQVRAVTSDAELSRTLRETPGAVTVLDSGYVTRAPLPRLTARLKLQFPDLAVLVLVEGQDYEELAEQLARDTIFGLLHKPATPQRLQQLLAHAWLRNDPAGKVWAAAPQHRSALKQHLTLVLMGLCLLAAIASGAYTLRAVYGPPREPPTAPLPAESPAEQLLTRADAAAAAGAFENATDLYRRAQQLAPGDPRVTQGVAVLMRRLLAASQTQLLDQHLERAQSLAKLAVDLQPDNPQVTQLVTQISALQHGAAAAGPGNSPPGLDESLGHAQELMRQGHLLDPPNDNALAVLEHARSLAPADAHLLEVQRTLVQMMLTAGRRAAAAGHPEEVLRYVGPVQELGALPGEVARMESRPGVGGGERLEKLAAAFNERLQQGKILEPANDSAKFYLALLVKTSPNSPASQIARLALGQRLIAEAQSAVRHQDFTGAKRWLAQAHDAGVDATSIANVEAILAATQALAKAPERAELAVIHNVEPDYPPKALAHHVKGSVDLQFTVRSDGTTGDFAVLSATPTGVFEQAALSAVRQWRYRPPVLKDGSPTQVRVAVKLNFTPY